MEQKININEIEKGEHYTVNGIDVYKDSEGKFIARQELSLSEQGAFSLYKAARLHESESIDNN